MQLQSPLDWAIAQAKHLIQALFNVFNSNLFTFGGEKFSLGSVTKLLVQALVVLIVAGAIKHLLKKRILPRFGLEVGTRESLSVITSYIVTIIGFLIVLQTAGINLSSLAVFAGGLGIGFGIGLQNLASNFISGLTLLFEQPIKVGDYIEVDKLAGTVEEIAIRSSTIRTVNGVFVIVPNSRFLDNNVVNWSYRDPNCRIVIPVRVTESSDSLTVMEALLTAARQEYRVLSSPSPEVYFKGQKKDTLKFELLVWIQNPADMDSIKSALQFLIEAEFRDRAIDTKLAATTVVLENLPTLAALLQLPTLQATNGSTTKAIAAAHNAESTTASEKPMGGWMLRDLLRKVSYFQQCGDIELRQVIEKGYRKKLASGEIICRENDPGDSFYIILSGAVEVFVESITQQVAVRRAGEFIGEMSLLIGTPRTATLRTLEETILFVVDRDNLQSLLNKHHELADKIAEELSQRQETLKSLGITIGATTKEETPFNQVRKRIQAIFGI